MTQIVFRYSSQALFGKGRGRDVKSKNRLYGEGHPSGVILAKDPSPFVYNYIFNPPRWQKLCLIGQFEAPKFFLPCLSNICMRVYSFNRSLAWVGIVHIIFTCHANKQVKTMKFPTEKYQQ